MTVGLYLLRAKQAGFTLDEMDQLERGDIFDVMTEMGNDNEKYPLKATQKDFDSVFGS